MYCGKAGNRISRTCGAGPNELSNPKVDSCKRIIMNDVMKLVVNKDKTASCAAVFLRFIIQQIKQNKHYCDFVAFYYCDCVALLSLIPNFAISAFFIFINHFYDRSWKL